FFSVSFDGAADRRNLFAGARLRPRASAIRADGSPSIRAALLANIEQQFPIGQFHKLTFIAAEVRDEFAALPGAAMVPAESGKGAPRLKPPHRYDQSAILHLESPSRTNDAAAPFGVCEVARNARQVNRF